MPEETYTEVDYRNKPYYHQIKRLQKRILTLGNLTQPKALGFWLQNSRSVAGSQQMTEKILKTIFGKDQQLSGNEVYARLKKHVGEIPGGEPKFVRHETAYQTTQRLVPSRGEEEEDEKAELARTRGQKRAQAPINKTLQVSALGDVYTKILEKYKNDPNLDSAIRHINASLAGGHFKDASSFVRWTVMSPSWIHIDAFQTDFFNKLKAEAYRLKQGGKPADPEEKLKETLINELRAHEDEFFKTGISYIMRSHPGVKMWTANTPELVKAVEHVSGDVKLMEYYSKLPKILGFRLIKMSDLEKKFHLSQEKNALMKHFKPALARYGKEQEISEEDVDDAIQKLALKMEHAITARKESSLEEKKLDKDEVNNIIQNTVNGEKLTSAFHQLLDDLTELANRKIQTVPAKKLKGIEEATALRSMKILTYLQKKKPYIMDFVNKVEGPGASIWWADRRMVFENTRFENRFVLEDIKRLAGLIRD